MVQSKHTKIDRQSDVIAATASYLSAQRASKCTIYKAKVSNNSAATASDYAIPQQQQHHANRACVIHQNYTRLMNGDFGFGFSFVNQNGTNNNNSNNNNNRNLNYNGYGERKENKLAHGLYYAIATINRITDGQFTRVKCTISHSNCLLAH